MLLQGTALSTIVILALTSAQAPGQGDVVGANNPTEIRLDDALETERMGPPAPVRQLDAPDTGLSYTPPARESAPLGRPSSALASHPANTNEAETVEDGWIAALDPRNNDITRVVFALAVVIGLLLLLRAAAKRIAKLDGGARPSGVMEVLARYTVARNHQLLLIKVARRVVLVHLSGQSMTTISEFEQPDEVAQLLARLEAGARGRQAEHFKDVLRSFETEQGETVRGEWESHLESIKPHAIVDLTRGGSGPLRGVFSRRRSA